MSQLIEIKLKEENEVLMYRAPGMMAFEPMKKESIVKADSGDLIKWVCFDESIKKIINIQVGIRKPGGGNWKDVWAIKPKKTSNESREFEGRIKEDPVSPENPEKDGYEISYINSQNMKKTIDPEIEIPKA